MELLRPQPDVDVAINANVVVPLLILLLLLLPRIGGLARDLFIFYVTPMRNLLGWLRLGRLGIA